MKKILLLTVLTANILVGFSQVKISTPAELMVTPLPDPSAMLEVQTTAAGILVPRMTTAQRDLITTPAISLLIFNLTTDQYEYYGATPVPGWVGLSRNDANNAWRTTGNTGTTSATNFLGTIDQRSLAFRTFNQNRVLIDSAGRTGFGTVTPNSVINIYGNDVPSFPFGGSQFFVGLYSRPTRLNTAATQISYGLLSHSNADGIGTYNAVAGRILRTGDTAQANLTAALGHVNRSGVNNFQTAVLGITNSRIDQFNDAQVFSAARFTDATGGITPAQDSSTYTIFASSARKNYFEGNIGVGTSFPNSRVNILGNNTAGFAFGVSQFFVGLYSRPTRLNTTATQISYGLLSHSNADGIGTYNAVAGRILRTGDTAQANLTAALGHVNRSGTSNFQTAVLGITNSRVDQFDDAQVFSAARFTDATGGITAAQDSSTYTVFASSTRKNYFEGNIGVGTAFPNSRVNILGNNTQGFAFGLSQFFVSLYSRPTRLNTAATQISYGLLSHSNADGIGTYNAVAGRILRTGDTAQANLTAALGHVNRSGTSNFQTAVLGITNSRIDQFNDAQVFSAARFTDATGGITAAQDSSTYTIFASSTRKNYFEGNIGVGTSFPNSRINILGNSTAGFTFGLNQFFVGLYSRPTRLNVAVSEISYGLLSHTNTNSIGTYNAIAGRVLRNSDTSLANLTAALGHVNRSGANNFQTAVLGIVNSRADQFDDAQVFSAARLSAPLTGAGVLTPTQLATTYTVFAPDSVKSFFKGNIGVNTNAPATSLDIDGGLAIRASAAVDLTADDQAVTVGNRSYVRLNSNSLTFTDRTFTLSNGLQTGQVLILENTNGNGSELVDAGNVNTAGNVGFGTAGATVSLIWNGTQWIETARSAN